MDGNTPSTISTAMNWMSRLTKKFFTSKSTIADTQKLEIKDNPHSVNIINNYQINIEITEYKTGHK